MAVGGVVVGVAAKMGGPFKLLIVDSVMANFRRTLATCHVTYNHTTAPSHVLQRVPLPRQACILNPAQIYAPPTQPNPTQPNPTHTLHAPGRTLWGAGS